MRKIYYQAYEIPISERRSGAIEVYLEENIGQELFQRFTRSKLEGNDTSTNYYIVRGCVAVKVEKDNDPPILRIMGLKGYLEKVLADIKRIAPELKPRKTR